MSAAKRAKARAAAAVPDAAFKQIVQSLNLAVAVIDPSTWSVMFENAKFFQWFPPDEAGDDALKARVKDLRIDRAMERLANGRPYTFDTEGKQGQRAVPLTVDIRPLSDGDDAPLLMECRDVSKQRQAEYMLESYSDLSEKNARALQKEKDRVEKLLLNIMPKAVYEEMKDFGTTTPQRYDNASVLMLDFVGFTDMAISRDPGAIIAELNDIFSAFDRIVELFGCERIKTIGDAYMAVSGLPEETPEHAHNVARVALRLKRYLEKRNAAHPEEWRCRIGLNSGPLVGSMVGIQKYVYDIFGPGVNLAARMEALSDPMTITVSDSTYRLIKDRFACTDLGEVEVKGFGTQRIYSLDGELG